MIPCRTEKFKNSFFPSTISEWNKLDVSIRNYDSFDKFKGALLKFIRPCYNSVFSIRDAKGLKLLTRLRLGLSHLNEHKFNHNFRDTLNPLCSCSLETESVGHYFLRCHYYNRIRTTLMNNLQIIDRSILNLCDKNLTDLLLFGNSRKYDNVVNTYILSCSIEFLISSQRFDESLL